MFLFRATIAALFRSRVEREQKEKQERERRKIAALLRDITDPAEAVGECLMTDNE